MWYYIVVVSDRMTGHCVERERERERAQFCNLLLKMHSKIYFQKKNEIVTVVYSNSSVGIVSFMHLVLQQN